MYHDIHVEVRRQCQFSLLTQIPETKPGQPVSLVVQLDTRTATFSGFNFPFSPKIFNMLLIPLQTLLFLYRNSIWVSFYK